MRRLLSTIFVMGLMIGAGTAMAGQSGNCSPQGTWYGGNSFGDQFIFTVARTGPQSFTVTMDNGINLPLDGTTRSTDWIGGLVKTGPRQYDFTTMSYWVAEAGGPFDPFPFLLGYCPLTIEFTSCDSAQGGGFCDIYGFFLGQDPFAEGIYLGTSDELTNAFHRMPMTFPTD